MLLTVAVADNLPKVQGDRVAVQQVLINLMLNSLDALGQTTDDQRRILVRAEPLDQGVVVFSVEDNGPGFPTAQLSELFVPYFTTKADGIGLGLSISRTIVEAHGGRIHAENRPTGGARILFSLPVAKAEDAA